MIKLLENFANSSAPAAPIAGQLFWNTTGSLMQVYTGTAWKTISSSTASASTPSNSVTGDLWWDTTNSQLKVYNGSSYVLIGPAFTAGTGQSGPTVVTITDSLAASHVVVEMYVSDVIVGIVSKDTEFTPQTAISGFATIKPGYNISTTVTNARYNGESDDAVTLGGLAVGSFLRSDASDTMTGTLAFANDAGITIGSGADLDISITGSDATIKNVTSDGDIIFNVNDGGVPTAAMTIDGATSRVLVAGDPTTALGIASKGYVDTYSLLATGAVTIKGILLPDGNGTRDLGGSATKFATIYGTTFSGVSTTAQYADLAENFSADAMYAPGTIVALGGAAEITRVNDELSNDVFGVVSTNPAHLMNAGLSNGTAIALSGRTPVRVQGTVQKGDRLVSAGNGYARAALPGEATSFNTVGRAIESGSDQLIEAFVVVN